MRRFIFAIIWLILSVWIGVKIAEDPGLALFLYRDWSVEMPLWFAVLCSLIFLMLFYVIIQLFDEFDVSVFRFRNWLRWRRKSKSYSKTNRGLLELVEGRWNAAERNLLDGIDQSDAPLINYLGAAKAAHERKAYDKRDLYLRKAHDIAPQAEVPIGLTQAELQFKQGQLEQALATLNHLLVVAPKHPRVLILLERIYIRLADWEALRKLIPRLRKGKVFTEEQLNKLELHVYEQLLEATAQRTTNIAQLRSVWQSIPSRYQRHPALIAIYVKHMLPYKECHAEAENLIIRALKQNYHDDLVKLFGELDDLPLQKKLSYCEMWMKQYPYQPRLLYLAGKLCMQNQLWGKARTYFEESLRLAPKADTYAAYGELIERLGDKDQAVKIFKEGLMEFNN